MKQFKYTLDKSSKKFPCPKCNKRTFVKYIETETGNYLNDTIGRCDRQTNCGYHNPPNGEYNNTFEVVNVPPPEPSFHDYNLVNESGRNYKQNNFVQFLKTIFSDAEVKEAISKYLIGTSKRWNGATIFWQIDMFERVHAGKILQFGLNGKRFKDKEGKGLIDWTHSILKRNHLIQDFNLKQCLFGLHLIKDAKHNTIALVEGEKTAVIMSVFKPEYTWLSTGSKSGLKYDFLKAIKQYKIVAFPDKSEYADWLKKAFELNTLGFKIEVNDWIEKQSDLEDGTDLADVLISLKQNAINNKSSENQIDYTETECKVHRLEEKFPELRNLIDFFDLCDEYSNEIRLTDHLKNKKE
jgi:hypothetical protein